MFMLRLQLKIVLIPVILVVTLLQWIGVFLTSVSSVIFFILSSIVFLIAVLSWVFQIAPNMEVLKMLVISFAVFIVPHIGEWIIDRITDMNCCMRAFVRAK